MRTFVFGFENVIFAKKMPTRCVIIKYVYIFLTCYFATCNLVAECKLRGYVIKINLYWFTIYKFVNLCFFVHL